MMRGGCWPLMSVAVVLSDNTRPSLRTTSIDAAGAISTLCPSTETMRVSTRVPTVIRVPETACWPERTVMTLTYSGDSRVETSEKVMWCSAAIWGALTKEALSWPVATSRPFRAHRVRILVPDPAISPW